jgi:hypothetical protein
MLRIPAALPASLRLLRSAVPALYFFRSLRSPGTGHHGPGDFGRSPWLPSPLSSGGGDRASQVPGQPLVHMPCSSTPEGPLESGHHDSRDAAFRVLDRVGSLIRKFRGSIARPAHSLSTLRRMGHPIATQDSLPAAGQLCRAGFNPLGSITRFPVAFWPSILLVQALPGATKNFRCKGRIFNVISQSPAGWTFYDDRLRPRAGCSRSLLTSLIVLSKNTQCYE